MRKIIVTVAQTGGIHTKEVNPNLPEQPEEIAQSAYECFNEGAAVVHIHARDKNGMPSGDPEIYREIHELIRAKCNIILQDTTGGGPNLSLEEKVRCLEASPEMASLNMGTMVRTVGKYAGTVFMNTRSDIEHFAQEMLKRDIKPEMEVYHHGMFTEVHNLVTKGLIKKPYYINFVLGMPYQGAVRATAENLLTLKQLLLPDSIFNCCAIGAAQVPMVTLSILLGGMGRVGLEDNIYYGKGVLAKSNSQLVARMIRIIRELGFEIASPDEAREILNLEPVA